MVSLVALTQKAPINQMDPLGFNARLKTLKAIPKTIEGPPVIIKGPINGVTCPNVSFVKKWVTLLSTTHRSINLVSQQIVQLHQLNKTKSGFLTLLPPITLLVIWRIYQFTQSIMEQMK